MDVRYWYNFDVVNRQSNRYRNNRVTRLMVCNRHWVVVIHSITLYGDG